MRWKGWLITSSLVFAVLLAIPPLVLYHFGFFEDPDFSKLEDYHAKSIFYDVNGEEIAEYCEFCREPVTLQEMGHFPQIAIAVEDQRFESRVLPYDIFAVGRAAWCYARTRKSCGGASTLSMELARNLFLQPELKKQWAAKDQAEKKSIIRRRKIREAWMAARLEMHFGRENRWKILELYLNTANCGGNFYGVKACSRHYWDKDPRELSEVQAAWIAAMWRLPRLGSLHEEDREEALQLRNRVLKQLVSAGRITTEQERELSETSLPEPRIRTKEGDCVAGHAAEFARLAVGKNMRIVDEGLKVQTTIDCDLQRTGSWALNRALEDMRERNPELQSDLEGVAILLDARNGDLKAFVQEPGFDVNQYRADLIKRHAGSTAKAYGVLMHLLHGGRLARNDEGDGRYACIDSPLSLALGRGKVKHFSNFPYKGLPQYRGSMELLQGLEESRNLCYLSLIRGISGGLGLYRKDDLTETLLRLKIELPKTQGTDILSEELALRLGIERNFLDPGHSGIVGSFGISPMELARSWTAFYDGVMVEPRIVDHISEAQGEPVHFPPRYYGNVVAKMWVEVQKETLRRNEVERLRKQYREQGVYKSKRAIYRKVFETMKFDEGDLDKKAPDAVRLITLALTRGLRSTVMGEHGTAKLARLGDENRDIPKLDFDLACKTGTAADNQGKTTDNWIACRTVSHVAVVWIGRKNNLPMESTDQNGQKFQETGGGNALPVAIALLYDLYENLPKEQFPETTNPLKPLQFSIPSPDSQDEESPEPEFQDDF